MDALKSIRQRLRDDPGNLELANVYWAALAGQSGEADLRCGRDVIDAYREAALRSREGAVAFATAYRELFQESGEGPRITYFDEGLILALRRCVSGLSEEERFNVEWILQSIEA